MSAPQQTKDQASVPAPSANQGTAPALATQQCQCKGHCQCQVVVPRQQMHLASSFYFSDPIYSPIMPHGGIGDFLTHAIAALPHQIRLDVVETDAEFRVSAELPGVALKDVNIDVDACNVLRISAVHAERELHDDVVGGVTYHLSERTAGRQTRSLQMPGNADASRITAKLEQGVLSISVPKIAAHEARGRRRIVVNAA